MTVVGDGTVAPRGPGGTDDVPSLEWVYHDLERIEKHWTDQVQNQQRRIAAVLAVNGFLLAFLATLGIQNVSSNTGWSKYPFFACLIILAIALIFGVLTLMPRIPVDSSRRPPGESGPPVDDPSAEGDEVGGRDQTGPGGRDWRAWLKDTFWTPDPDSLDQLWLDSTRIWDRYKASGASGASGSLLWELCESISRNQRGNLDLCRTQVRRRKWMHWQMAGIMASLLLLIVAIAARMFQLT